MTPYDIYWLTRLDHMLANNADVQEIGADVVGLAKDWLEELKP